MIIMVPTFQHNPRLVSILQITTELVLTITHTDCKLFDYQNTE